MVRKIILERDRFFISGEGESEQSFIKFLGMLCEQQGMHLHLDCQVLGGGGYQVQLENTIFYRARNDRVSAKATLLIVDSDRSERGDDSWTIEQLKHEASKENIVVCVQQPNFEGLLVRLLSAKTSAHISVSSGKSQLARLWPDYDKPASARMLVGKLTLADLLRVAKMDSELGKLLSIIGLSK
jgi:hypothetical protein